MAALQQVARGNPVFRKEDCSPFDIGVVLNGVSSFSDAEKFEFIEKIWNPRNDPLVVFPQTVENGNKKRKFRREWLQEYPWLAYSKYLDGAFCLPCVLFDFGHSKVDKLVKSPLTLWTSASTRINKHCSGKCESHNRAVLRMDNFVRAMRREVIPVDQQLNNILQEQIAKNREILSSLFKSIIFCGRHNIALRGHRDDNPRDKPIQGNYHALLDFRVDSGDKILEDHLLNAPRNSTYVSKTIQNEMILTVGKYILDRVSNEIRVSKYFAILADEAADISNKENLAIVIRFVDASSTIREEFIGYYLCTEGTTGEAIKDIILKVVNDLGLSMDDCRGQCYDGAGNMAGKFNGASSLIKGQYEKAIYVHCMNHRLNLCVADTCSIRLVKNMMGVVRKLSEFFSNSPKRQDYLIKKVKDMMPDSNHRVLIDVCKTRWIARIDGMDRIVELLLPVISTLEDISMNIDEYGDQQWNQNSRTDAQALINAINFSFIVTLVVVRYILDLTRPLTVKLQAKEIDLLKAKDEIDSLKRALTTMQRAIDDRHQELYREAVELAHEIHIEPSMPRITQRQVHRANAPGQTPEDYYRINLTRVFLDHALQQLNTRFQDQVYVCYKGLSVIPTNVIDHPTTWKDSVKEFCQEYNQDIPNNAGLDPELIMWERKCEDHFENQGNADLPDRELKFPSVTICNRNMLKKSKILGGDGQRYLDGQNSKLKNKWQKIYQKINNSFDIEQEVLQNGHNVSDVVVDCQYDANAIHCQHTVHFTILFDFMSGMCHTFNTDKPVRKLGERYGLELLLDVEPHEYYGPLSLGGTGFKIIIHDPDTIPFALQDGINIPTGFSTNLRIRKKKRINLEDPYPTKCSAKKLKTSDVYSESRCQIESYARYGMDQCNCTVLGLTKYVDEKRLCHIKKIMQCLYVKMYIYTPNRDDCPISCESTTFDVFGSSLTYPSESAWDSFMNDENNLRLYKTSNLNNASFRDWYRGRFAVVKVFFDTNVVEVTREVPAFDVLDLAGNFGGNMGLYLGCSVLTLVEFIDLIVLVLIEWFKKPKENKILVVATNTQGE